MSAHAGRARLLGAALCFAFAVGILAEGSFAYDTSTGTKPEVQAKRVVNTQTHPISDFAIIREAGGRCEEIADIINDQLGMSLPCTTLALRNDNADQIVLGDLSNATIASAAALFNMNAIDLGKEGYNLYSMPNPRSTNGSWIVFILAAADCAEGIYRGACTLVDLVETSGTDAIGNFRIRDYPDRPFRGIMHWIGSVGVSSGASWVQAKKDSLERISGWGCNAVSLGVSDFWRMDDADASGQNLLGRWMNETAYWSRYYGMEPIPEVWHLPYALRWNHPLWREGELIKDEAFGVGTDSLLYPLVTPFDNVACNMDLETGTSWPSLWERDASGAWSYITGSGDDYVRFSRPSGTGLAPCLYQSLSASLLQPRSYYVLQCKFSNVTDSGNGWYIGIFVKKDGVWKPIFHEKVDNCPEASMTKDYFFWTPPTEAQAPSGYLDGPFCTDSNFFHSYWDGVSDVKVQLYSATTGQSTLDLHSFFLERRAGALRNVMLDPTDGLELVVTDTSGTPFYEGSDYEVLSPPQSPDWGMRTERYVNGNLVDNTTSIRWIGSGTPPSRVLVSYTAGVPEDWSSEGQKTTVCMKNPAYLDCVRGVLESFYKSYTVDVGGLTSYALNPKYLDLRIDEVRGTNRCGRCADFDAGGNEIQDNDTHLLGWITTIQDMLDDLKATYPAAGETKLIASDNMLSRYRNGKYADYQYQFGGPWGGVSVDLLADLQGVDNDILFSMTHVDLANLARSLGWPRLECAPGQDNVFVIGTMQSMSGSTQDYPEDWAPSSTWYEEDAVGFSSVGYSEHHTEIERRLIDYAWKRYAHPDATMQAYYPIEFVTDDVGGRTINIGRGTSASFAPFGNPEARDSTLAGWTTSWASIWWGGGTPQNVLSSLNKSLVSHTFSTNGEFNITLDVRVVPPGGGTAIAQFATIVVNVSDIIPIDPVQEHPEPVAFGVRSIAPNPFNPATRIRFGLREPGEVHLAIYDVEGRRVATLIDNRGMPAGAHTITWNGTNGNGARVASGVYFVRLKQAQNVQTKKVVLLR